MSTCGQTRSDPRPLTPPENPTAGRAIPGPPGPGTNPPSSTLPPATNRRDTMKGILAWVIGIPIPIIIILYLLDVF